MRSLSLAIVALFASAGLATAEPVVIGAQPDGAKEEKKKNANPCRDEVAAALGKLRKSSWFHMATKMITENGPVSMDVDYVLPDKMHQTVTQTLTKQTSEVVLVGDKAWGNQGAGWQELPGDVMSALKAQLYENVIQEQTDVGEYACKGKVQVEGRDALSYKLEDEVIKGSVAPKNETYRIFYVDPVTGLPIGNALLAPGRETTPLFKATYTYPLDMKIEAPKDAAPAAPVDEKK